MCSRRRGAESTHAGCALSGGDAESTHAGCALSGRGAESTHAGSALSGRGAESTHAGSALSGGDRRFALTIKPPITSYWDIIISCVSYGPYNNTGMLQYAYEILFVRVAGNCRNC